MSVYYDRNGNPLGGMNDYIRAESLEGRRVARTFVGDVELSTVWLGIDHSFGLGDHILIFESMCFGGPHDMAQQRYPDEESALRGHIAAVDLLRAGHDPFGDDDE